MTGQQTRPAAAPAAGSTAAPKAASRPRAAAKPSGKTAARPAAEKTPRRRLSLRPRLLPLTIFAAVLLLGARVGDIWTAVTTGGEFPGVTQVVASQGVAEVLPPVRQEPPADSPARIQVAEATAPQPATAAQAPAAEAAPAEEDDRTFTPTEVEILQRLQERREQLDSRSRQLDQREALVQVAEQRVEQKIAELETIKSEISSLLVQVNEQEQARLDSLVKIYETMKPKEAAAVFEGLDQEVLLDVIGRMRESKLAPIFGAMDPKKAAEITALRAHRVTVPTLPN